MQELFMLMSQYGFPMVVAMFLLVRIEGRLGALNDSIQILTQTIAGKEIFFAGK